MSDRFQHAVKVSFVVLGGLVLWGATSSGESPRPVVKTQGFLPFGDAPIHYRVSQTLTDQITQLNRQLERGEAKLEYDPKHGYLRSTLRLLGVPESSQTLVFSKTSLQFQHISPQTPRALYFNDNVYVGQVHGGKSIELIAFDAMQGAVFYVLSEHETEHPRFERSQMDCVQCHIATATRRIPGVMVRSVLTSSAGNPKGGAPVYTMGHETPLEQRFGGWYVTGSTLPVKHIGNQAAALGQNLAELAGVIDTQRFLSAHSDVVAHLVLAHQTQMHNVVTELNYRFRLGLYAEQQRTGKQNLTLEQISPATRQQYQSVAEEALRYLLFQGEVKLPAPIRGSSTFTKDFAALGPRDRKGRSLRDFDLETRIFKYRLSYLIYSDAFDAIPAPARDYLLHRLFEVLTGHDQSPEFAGLGPAERRAILEILADTKPGLPREWAAYLESAADQQSATTVTTPAAMPAQRLR